MLRPLATLAAIACLAGGLAACGGGGDDDPQGGSQGASTGSKTGPASGVKGKAGAVVGMKDIQFVPMDITVKRGTIVRWNNTDSVTHNVLREDGPANLRSPNLNPGQSYQAKLDRPGVINYVCTIHPNQTGKITVK